MVIKSLGDRIRKVREGKSLSQEALAGAMDVTPATINRYEKGHRTPDAGFLNRLVSYLDCDPGWLLTGKETHVVAETHASYGQRDEVIEKIGQMLGGMDEDKRRDILRYVEEKKLLADLLEERRNKERGRDK